MARPKKKSVERKVVPKTKARELIGTAVGAAVGSVIGRLFAEDPDGFVKIVMDNVGKLQATGAWNIPGAPVGEPMQPDPHEHDWFKGGRAAAQWLAAPEDHKDHAFAMGFDAPPGRSACGALYLKEPFYLLASKGRCSECEKVLVDNNYDISDVRPRPPGSNGASAPHGKRSRSKKANV